MAKPEGVIEMPALGRPFHLGMLYNCHRDALFPEHFLLDPEFCKKIIKQEKVTMGLVSCNTLGEKAAALGIKPPLLTSLLCGLFDVEGSAEYLLSTQWSRRSPGSLTYKSFSIESSEMLNINALSPEHFSWQNVEECQATHVVTVVWLGGLCFRDYETNASSSDPTMMMGAKAKPNEEKAAFPSHKQTPLETEDPGEKPRWLGSQVAHLDPMPPAHPSSSKLLGKAEERGVPVKVRLYPLAKLKLTQPLLANPSHEISHDLDLAIQEEMTSLVELEADCQALLSSPAAKKFPEVGKKIRTFRGRCSQSKLGAQAKLAEMVPLVREGQKEEKELVGVLKQVKESTLQLRRSFSRTKEEVSLVDSIFSCLRELEDATTGLKPRAEFVVAFVFTSLQGEAPSFPPLQRHPLPSRGKQPSTFGGETRSGLEWFEDQAVVERVREVANSFLSFARANASSQKTDFEVRSAPDKSSPGASVYLYERGELKETHFEPPSKPLPIQVGEISHDRVQLRLTPGSRGKEAVSGYQIEHRATAGKEAWVPSVTKEQEGTFTLGGLQPETEYEFRYASVSRPGLSEHSEVTSPIKTLPGPPLPKPSGDAGAEKRSPGLHYGFGTEETNPTWSKGSACKESERGKDGRQPNAWEEEAGAPPALVQPARTTGGGGGATCAPDSRGCSKAIASLRNASRVLKKGPPSVYVLPLEKVNSSKDHWIKYRFGEPDGLPSDHKVIMLLGETGAGKSMLIDGMMNYLLGVRWNDDFRFSLVQEDPKRSQAESQTDTLMVYEVHLDPGQQDLGSLTLIDTPGFGDTRGKQWDQRLRGNIQELFSHPCGVRHIDVIGIVVQGSQSRLTQPQKYIFDQMFSIFGREIRDNIQLLITFADGKTPPVLGSLGAEDDLPCARDAWGALVHFPFNNSALFASNIPAEDEDSFHFNHMFWEMGLRSMQAFFQALKGLQPWSVALAADVLNKQKALEAFMALVRPRVQKALVELVLAKKTYRILQDRWDDLQAGRDVVYLMDICPRQRTVGDIKCRLLNCQKCKYTCQDGFQTLDKSGYKTWFFMNTPHCVVCAGQCAWEDHSYEHTKWEYPIVKERRRYSQQMFFQRTYNKGGTANDVLDMALHEAEQAEKEFLKLLEMVSAHLQKKPQTSQQDALCEYIDLLMAWEEKDAQEGFKDRQLLLRNLKERVLSNASLSHGASESRGSKRNALCN